MDLEETASATKAAESITTTDQLTAYLLASQKKLSFLPPGASSWSLSSIKRLSGGSANYVWRIHIDIDSTAIERGTAATTDSSMTTTQAGKRARSDTIIVKHAEPYLASDPGFAFSVGRMTYEVRALTELPGLIGTTRPDDDQYYIDNKEAVGLPRVRYFDEPNHVLFFEDLGSSSRTLANSYTDPTIDIPSIGARLGKWLARLHTGTTNLGVRRQFEHSIAKKMYRWNFNNLAYVLENYGYDKDLGERINAKFGALLDTDDVCVVHGDLWPGNIVLSRDGGDDAGDVGVERGIVTNGNADHREQEQLQHWQGQQEQTVTPEMESHQETNPHQNGCQQQGQQQQHPQLTVIDWEAARNGNGMTDVGHFAGEAWFLDTLRGNRGLMDSVLTAYISERRHADGRCCLSKGDRWRIVAQFAAYVTHWPTIYDWIGEDETRRCVAVGAEMLHKVDEMDEEWFCVQSPLAMVFADRA